MRNHFLFEDAKRKIVTVIVLFANLMYLFVWAYYFTPAEGLTISRAMAIKIIFQNAISITAYMACELYFDNLREEVFNDVTRHSARIEKSSKEKEVFFACMSHEIRNPLQSLLGSVELLQQCHDSAQRDVFTSIIRSGCEIVINLVSNVLDVSKIEAKKMDISLAPSSLSENVSKVVRMLGDRTKAKGLALEYVESSSLPPCLLFDPYRLHQVILNLASNAIKFTQKGKIVIATTWIPLQGPIANALKRELNLSSWKSVICPTCEVEDEKEEMNKRLKVCAGNCFTPSDRRGSIRAANFEPICTEPAKFRFSNAAANLSSDSGLKLYHRGHPQSKSSKHFKNPIQVKSSLAKLQTHTKVSQEQKEFPSPIPEDYRKGDKSPQSGINSQDDLEGAEKNEKSSMCSIESPNIECLKSHTRYPEKAASVVKGLIKLEVMDTGIGISKEGLERLFKPFQQADSTITQYIQSTLNYLEVTVEPDSVSGSLVQSYN